MALIPPADAAVFDLDGVIVDSRDAVRTAVNETLVEHGFVQRPAEDLDRFIGPPVFAAFAELTGEPVASELVAACAATYHEHYARVYLLRTRLIDGMLGVLDALSMPLALATAKPVDFVAPLLAALAIADRFRVVSAPAMSALDEPKSVTVGRALGALRASRAVVVGDRSFDIDAAHANGARAIGVTWGIGDFAELRRAGAEVIVERPWELVASLEPG